MSTYGPPHPPSPGPSPDEARAALALTERSPIPVRVRDLVLYSVAMVGIQVAILLAVFGVLPESWPTWLGAVVAGAVVLPFAYLQNFVRSLPRGFKTKAGLASLLASWFALWVSSKDWSAGVQLATVAAGFVVAVVTPALVELRRR